MTRLLRFPTAVVLSDLHIADPTIAALDDFGRDDEFARLLGETIPARIGGPTTLILNGDFLDFVRVLPDLARDSPGDLFGATEEQSCEKFKAIARGHPAVFDAIKVHLEGGGHVRLLPGNHDPDFYWDGVQDLFRAALGNPGAPEYFFVAEGEIRERGVYIEHGHQRSFDNRFGIWPGPFVIDPSGVRRLERPWGTMFLDRVFNDVAQRYSFTNRIYPIAQLALIALRSQLSRQPASRRLLARLVAFFGTKGHRLIAGHFLGREPVKAGTPPMTVGGFEAFVARVLPDLDSEERASIAAEAASLARPGDASIAGSLLSSDYFLGGGGDESGMMRHAEWLFEAGDIELFVYGHTHDLVDGKGQARPVFNTGCWLPRAQISYDPTLTWDQLHDVPCREDIRYLLIEFGETPTAELIPI